MLRQEHYYRISNPSGFLGTNFLCDYCYKEFKGYCQVCNDPVCPTQELAPVECMDCHRKCHLLSCLARHKESKLKHVNGEDVSLCDKVKKCKKCGLCYCIYTAGKTMHQCGATICKICGCKLSSINPVIISVTLAPSKKTDHPNLFFMILKSMLTVM